MPLKSRHRPLFILVVGFALVIGTLALLAWLGFNQSEGIRRQANELVSEHLFALNLIEGLELEQNRAGTILLELSRSRTERAGEKLREFEQALPGLTQDGARILPSPIWSELEKGAQRYVVTVRLSIQKHGTLDSKLSTVQNSYDELVRLIDEALKLDALRAAAGGRSIERASSRLTSQSGLLLVGAFLLSLLSAILTIRFALQSMRQISWQVRELNRVSWHLIQGQEDAARRFSHELHDELGQALTGLKATLSAVPPQDFSRQRPACLNLLDEAIGNVRELSQLLRPIILDDFGLPAALRWLVKRFEERTRIEVEVDFSEVGRLADDVETHLYRITQEALTNVARHANATAARLELEQIGEEIQLTITDNGSGLPRTQLKEPSLGVVGMRARAEQLGGYFKLANRPEGGVQVQVRVPARQPEEEEVIDG